VEYLYLAFLTFLDFTVREELIPQKIPHKKMVSVSKKKHDFYKKIIPAVEKVHTQLQQEYEKTIKELETNTNPQHIESLKAKYKVQSDRELLMAMKPHPKSITIAQAAMESAWGTSRFFKEANNVFGMWSINKNEPRIAAGEQRNGKRTIYLKKFSTIEDSIRAYYLTLSRAKTYKKFREINYETDNPFLIIQGLAKYSERGQEYVKELAQMIRFNNLTKYDQQMQVQ
jgi:Bax protein